MVSKLFYITNVIDKYIISWNLTFFENTSFRLTTFSNAVVNMAMVLKNKCFVFHGICFISTQNILRILWKDWY